jgi:hypothetical protein
MLNEQSCDCKRGRGADRNAQQAAVQCCTTGLSHAIYGFCMMVGVWGATMLVLELYPLNEFHLAVKIHS